MSGFLFFLIGENLLNYPELREHEHFLRQKVICHPHESSNSSSGTEKNGFADSLTSYSLPNLNFEISSTKNIMDLNSVSFLPLSVWLEYTKE